MPDRLWEIMEDAETGVVTIYRSNGFGADSEGPTLTSYEEMEEFISALRNAASHVFVP